MQTDKNERERQLRDWMAASYYRRFHVLAEEVGVSATTLHRFFRGYALTYQTLDRLERHRAKQAIVTPSLSEAN